jgi:superfamily I DNA and/or RNA helicase
VAPFTGVLKKQCRMHPSISELPRRFFHNDKALFDGIPTPNPTCCVRLVQVDGRDVDNRNLAEVDAICAVLAQLGGQDAKPSILVITPYRNQERPLRESIEHVRENGSLGGLNVEVCTLDRCQGREADHVLVSLVRRKATMFLDSPKRWNVALTRGPPGPVHLRRRRGLPVVARH